VYVELSRSGSDATFADFRATYLGGAGTIPAGDQSAVAGWLRHPETWHAFTMWICDEGRDCSRVLWRVPWKVQDDDGTLRNLTEFVAQFNTSTRPAVRTGNVIAYVRNWMAFRNYNVDMSGADSAEDIARNTGLLRKPSR
jgi:hypothetical protein